MSVKKSIAAVYFSRSRVRVRVWRWRLCLREEGDEERGFHKHARSQFGFLFCCSNRFSTYSQTSLCIGTLLRKTCAFVHYEGQVEEKTHEAVEAEAQENEAEIQVGTAPLAGAVGSNNSGSCPLLCFSFLLNV